MIEMSLTDHYLFDGVGFKQKAVSNIQRNIIISVYNTIV